MDEKEKRKIVKRHYENLRKCEELERKIYRSSAQKKIAWLKQWKRRFKKL